MEKNDLEVKKITFRCRKINPNSIREYIDAGGYQALDKALEMSGSQIIQEINNAGLRGRGGAGFPAGVKWDYVKRNPAETKYIVCNADEGEPGNFKDRYLIENDPHQLLEGMIIAAYSTGGNIGYIYIRGEYTKAIKILTQAVVTAREYGYLGRNIRGKNFDFDILIKSGAGAYVCGEEFALIESLEGNAGRPRNKPPFPTVSGIYNKPTLINNVETFCNVPVIITQGADEYINIGVKGSAGTKLVCLSGNVNNKGVFEVPFGISLKDIIYEIGKGIPGKRKIAMVQIGGHSGPLLPYSMLNINMDYDTFCREGISMGTGAVIVIDERFDVLEIVTKAVEFFEHESCGKCTPCREGNKQMLRLINKFSSAAAEAEDIVLLKTLGKIMQETSFCGLGSAAPTAVLTTLRYFKEEYEKRIINQNEDK